MGIKLRRLNDEGLDLFKDYIDSLRNGIVQEAYPAYLIEDERYSEEVSLGIEVEDIEFETRYEMGSLLVGLFRNHDDQGILGDGGIWGWLALFWFFQICRKDNSGNLKPNQTYNYILSDRFNHRPRHAIRTTYMLVRDHGENARVLLSKKPYQRGEIVEQLAARQFYLNCAGVVESLCELYFNPASKSFKRGAAGKGAGSSRRFVAYLQQIEKTYDLYSIPASTLMAMLPAEYKRFMP